MEKVYPLQSQIADDEKYSLFLVNRVTLRDDGQPIEGRGVDPQISIKDPNWKKELLKKFNYPGIVKAIEEIYKGEQVFSFFESESWLCRGVFLTFRR